MLGTLLKVFSIKLVLALMVLWYITSTQRQVESSEIKLPTYDAMVYAAPNVQLYIYLKDVSKRHKVPVDYLKRCLKEETGYKGLSHYGYNPNQVSAAHAYGPWQIQVPTARFLWGNKLAKFTDRQVINLLKFDMRFGAETAGRYLEYLYHIYGNWPMTFAAYNRGPGNVENRDDVNAYARRICNR